MAKQNSDILGSENSLLSIEAELSDAAEFQPLYSAAVLREMRKLGAPKPAEVSEADWAEAIPPIVLSKREQLRKDLEGVSITQGDKSILSKLAIDAVLTVSEIIDDRNVSPNVRLAASVFVLDQNFGKAGQVIEHKGSIFHELQKSVEEVRALNASNQATIPAPKDAIETIVDTFFEERGGTFVVGKRESSDGSEKSE